MTTSGLTSAGLLWRIGDPGGAPTALNTSLFTGGDDGDLVFDVATCDPALHWPALHPGPLNGSSGFRDVSVSVLFRLEQVQVDAELVLSFWSSHGPCPQLRVEVNGAAAIVIARPRREDRRQFVGPSPVSGPCLVTLPLPAGSLRRGDNRIIISTTSDLPPEHGPRRPQPQFGSWFGSAITWSYLELRAATAAPQLLAVLQPLPLFKRSGAELLQLVDVVVEAPRSADGVVHLSLEGRDFRCPVEFADRAFGHARVRLEIPEITTESTARLSVQVGPDVVTDEVEVRPSRKWTLHLMPHVHLDVGYTDYQAKVLELHSRNLDRAVDLIAATPDYRFAVDGSFVLDQYLQTRAPEQVERVLSALGSGSLSVNAFGLLFLSGLATLEECYRSAYGAAGLQAAHAVPVTYANLTDVPSYTGALPGMLRDMGIDAFLGIQNHTRGANADSDTLHLDSPVRWQGLDGRDVLAFFSDSYSQLRFLCADPPTNLGLREALTRLLERYERPDYLPSDLPIVGIYADNEDLADGEADAVERWHSEYAWPRLRFSTPADYFDAVRPLRERLPVHRGDGGAYWEDGVGSHARAQSAYRRAQSLLPQAEALAVLLNSLDDRLRPALARLDQGWQALAIGCEHTWTSSHATAAPHTHQTSEQTRWKELEIAQAEQIASDECRRELAQLGELVTTDGPTVLVVNTLSWRRSVTAEVEVAVGSVLSCDGDVHDHDVLTAADGFQLVRLRIPDVPAFGYRTLQVRGADPVPPTPDELDVEAKPERVEDAHAPSSIRGSSGVVMSQRYRLLVSNGRITSLRWLPQDRELVDPASPWGLVELVYVSGGGSEARRGLGSEATSLRDFDPRLPPPALDATTVHLDQMEVRRSAQGVELRLTGSGPLLPRVAVSVVLPDADDRIAVEVLLDKEPTLAKESLYVAFPFLAERPTIRYSRQVGWVNPAQDHLVGGCNEWFTTLDAVTVSTDDICLTWTSLDAPLFTLGDVVRGAWPTAISPTNGTVLSWVMNNYWFTNTPAQQAGQVTLRYALTPSAAFDAAACWRTGRDQRTPPLVAVVNWLDKADTAPRLLPADSGSLWQVDVPDHVLIGLSTARQGTGHIARIQEVGGTAATLRLRHPRREQGRARLCTALEDDRELLECRDGDVIVPIRPQEVLTVRLW